MKLANYIKEYGVSKKGIWVKSELYGAKKQIDLDEDLMLYLPEGINLSDICI